MLCQLFFAVVVAALCLADDRILVNRCCPFGQQLTQSLNCAPTTNEWFQTVVSTDWKVLVDFEEASSSWRIEVARPQCETPEFIGSPNLILIEDGTLWLRSEVVKNSSLFCVDDNAGLVCREQEAAELVRRVYVNKCCGNNSVFSHEKEDCVEDSFGRDGSLSVVLENTNAASVLNVDATAFDYGWPKCDDGFFFSGRLGERGSSLLPDGSLDIPTNDSKITLKPRTFCIEHIDGEPADESPSIFTCPNYFPALEPKSIEYEETDLRFILYPLGLLISVFFLAATLAAGSLLPSAHHLLHWRCQTCHIACLLIGDLLLAIVHLGSHHLIPLKLCSIIASLTHFFFLAAFFWLNTMCFNIWWTFRDMRPSTLDRRQEWLRLRLYNIYAWGVPIAISVAAVLLDNVSDDRFPPLLRPRFGETSCWFYGEMESLTFFFGPLGVLLTCNIILFTLTARELTCGLWKREMVKSNAERAALGRVCGKLVVVMGVSWITDIVSWAVGGPQYLWYATDIVNTLQGVFIFIVVACQPQVWAAGKRLWRPCQVQTTSVNGHHHNSSSQDAPSMNDSVANTNTSYKCPPGETIC